MPTEELEEDVSIMHLKQVQWLIDRGVRVSNVKLFKRDIVTEITVCLQNSKSLTYYLNLCPDRSQLIKIINDDGTIQEEKEFEHVYHAVRFIESKK